LITRHALDLALRSDRSLPLRDGRTGDPAEALPR
jgi:hypothetical protein